MKNIVFLVYFKKIYYNVCGVILMKYEICINEFEGPLDLLLHLVKQSNLNIQDINIDEIIKQYLNYIEKMEELNLNIASEYLIMAAELIEIKSSSLLPKQEELNDEFEEDPKEKLINRLLEYEKYKNMTNEFKTLEEFRHEIYTKEPSILYEYAENNEDIDYGVNLDDLVEAFSKFMEQKQLDKPLKTKITNKEISVTKRCSEIKKLLRKKKEIKFFDLFDNFSKEYVIVTFLAVLSMSRNQEICLQQKNNFENIIIKEKDAI